MRATLEFPPIIHKLRSTPNIEEKVLAEFCIFKKMNYLELVKPRKFNSFNSGLALSNVRGERVNRNLV